MKNKEYISTSEAATLLGVSRVSVFNRIKKGQIKAEKIGRNYIIEKNSLGGIFKNISLSEEKDVKRAMDRVLTEFAPALRKLGKE
jgi:excisionase family DNA binding protein